MGDKERPLSNEEKIRDGLEHRFVLKPGSKLFVQIAPKGTGSAASHTAMAEFQFWKEKNLAKGGYVRFQNGAFVRSESISSGLDAPTQEEFDAALEAGVQPMM